MTNIEKQLRDYFVFFIKTIEFWNSVPEKSATLLRPLINQTDQLRLCSRAQLEKEFLSKFPAVKEKLLGKILTCIEEEMIPIIRLEEEMKTYVDGLKTRLNAVEKEYTKISPEEEREFNPVVPSFDKLLEHAVDMWRCFHVLWLGVKTSIDMVDYLNSQSVRSISDSFLKFKQVEPQLKRVSDLTYYLRTQPNTKESSLR